MVKVKMVVMERELEEVVMMEVYVGGGVDVVEDGEVIARIVARDVTGVEGASSRLKVRWR